MAVTAQRRLETSTSWRFGSGREAHAIPDLTEIQTKSYARFLQYDTATDKRKDEGLEGVLRGIWAHNDRLGRARVHREGKVLVVAWNMGVSPSCWEAARRT